jgi:hypothetical protein
MKRYSIYILFFASGLFALSCSKDYLTEKELKKYILEEKNGLRKSVQHGDYTVDAIYRPNDLLILQEIGNSQPDSSALTKLSSKYSDHYYFILNLSKNGKEAVNPASMPYEEFSDVLQNVSFRMNELVNITTARQDTIALADFIYNRTFGMGSSSEILLVFDKKKATDTDWVQINLAELGLGIGSQNFRFEKEKLDEVPRIDFKELLKK